MKFLHSRKALHKFARGRQSNPSGRSVCFPYLLCPQHFGQKAVKREVSAAAVAPCPPVHHRAIHGYRSHRRGSFSLAKTILFHNNKTGIFNVYTVAVSGGGSSN